jgi:DNA integrity scanning protein DisA with diadenylate cyclase activity
MKRVEISSQLRSLLMGVRRVAVENDIETLVILAELPYDFLEISRTLKKVRLLVATDKPDVQRAAREDDVALVVLLDEPQTRQVQISQAIIDAVADELLESGKKIMAMYAGFERDVLDSVSIINLTEHLAKLTARDLRRLKTKVPLETLRIVVDLAIDIGNEGREGSPVGALFVVGDHRKVIRQSHEQVHDPFRGYGKKECLIRSPRVRESIKELAQLDGAFVISSDGVVHAAGRFLDAPAEGLTLSSGLGARHWAAAAISKATNAIAIAVSHSTGTVRIFQDGFVVLRIEPMQHGMKWSDVETEPPATSE